MSSWKFIWRSLKHHWRINLAVGLGVMAATAVLTGALLVGDSVRGSLLGLTLDRLGKIDEMLIGDRFFRVELADELSRAEGFGEHFSAAVPAIVFPSGTVEHKTDKGTNRAAQVLIFGSGEDLWQLSSQGVQPKKIPQRGEIVLNEPLAADLGVTTLDGDDPPVVTLRIPQDEALAADFSVGKKEGLVASVTELKVVAIIPAKSLGRFSLRASQSVPRNAYVSTDTIQRAIEQYDKVNAIFVSGKSNSSWQDSAPSEALAKLFQPKFEDYGFVMKRAELKFGIGDDQPEETIFDYFSFSTDRMVLDDDAATAAEHAFKTNLGQPMFTYLANSIGKGEPPAEGEDDNGIPWSMVTAVDFSPQFAPTSLETGKPIEPLEDDEVVLNQWSAEDLKAEIGDKIYVKYFEPETSHGEEVTRVARFVVKDVVGLTEPVREFDRLGRRSFKEKPTLANDPDLTPFVPGVTDQKSIEDWNLPFPTGTISGKDDNYWKRHRTTPKAFISLTRGRELWQSRFGETTTYRIPAEGTTADELKAAFLAQASRDGVRFGLEFTPIKRNNVAASSGTTPFDGLFLGLSFFIIVAALLLVSLLFRLGVEQRANELGILLAVGLMRKLSTRLLVAEGAIVAAIGGLVGVVVGVGYAWLMLKGLTTIWVGAILTPFLEYHWTTKSLLIGYFSGVLVSMLTIAWSIRQTKQVSIRQLMLGQASESGDSVESQGRWPGRIGCYLLIIAAVLVGVATQLGGEAQAGAFVGGGMMLLSGLLVFTWLYLRHGSRKAQGSNLGLVRLATRNAGRNPTRSTITIGLVAFASFLIAAMSCFRLAPTEQGTGGYGLIAQSSRPIFADLNTRQGKEEMLGDAADDLHGMDVVSMRLRPGDDASCNNLYQSSQPRMLGVKSKGLGEFSFSAYADHPSGRNLKGHGSWRTLDRKGMEIPEDVIPVVIDKNTAMYSLKLYFGIGQEFEREYDGQKIKFRVVGLLENSVLQGSLIIHEDDFRELFPQISGYRFFLLSGSERTLPILEEKLGDQGFDAQLSVKVLEQLFAVQNTYLSTFQSLGALGLLLGTIGLATVQLRSVLERRKELALMRASGFARGRLAKMVVIENGLLLFGGLFTGIVAALLAVLPHMVFGAASVPFTELAVMLSLVLIVGFLSGFAAVRATLNAPLLSALRGN